MLSLVSQAKFLSTMTTNNPSFFERANNWVKTSITLKIFTIGILILLLLIPVSMVERLIDERKYRQEEAITEVSSKWGEAQTITGPVLTVPYLTYSKVYESGNTGKYTLVQTKAYAHFLPDELNVNGNVVPEKRYRGMYEIIVYNSQVTLNGTFSFPSFQQWKTDPKNVVLDGAFISIGLSDLRSIQKNVAIKWNDKDYFFNPGLESNDVIEKGVSTHLPLNMLDSASSYKFSVNLNFNGSSSLNFVPLGKDTKVNIASTWKDPSFDGAFLPDDRTINEQGFKASWNVLHLNRSYPQQFTGEAKGIKESAFGVNLIVPVDEYQKSMRSAKYAVMFITLTFLIFFFVQILNKVRVHPIQYLIVGLALCVFYTLLIALSEHIPFQYAYLVSSIAIISMITLYAKNIFKNAGLTRLIGGILIALYLFIYTIIQMEDYALLMGSIGLFLVLAAIMYLSRKIDWYAIHSKGEAKTNEPN